MSSAESRSDEFTAPLCRGLGAAHRSGDKTVWWRQIDTDPTKMALKRPRPLLPVEPSIERRGLRPPRRRRLLALHVVRYKQGHIIE
jgi:hypothetical protein